MNTDSGSTILVDPDAKAWAGAWDVYFPAPLSLSLVANTFAHNGMQRELGLLIDLHDDEAGAIVADLRELLPAVRPQLTAIAHHSVPGQEAMHLHVHTYVARTATAPSTGERAPVIRADLAAAAATAWHRYAGRLRELTTEALGFGWDPLPDDPAAADGTDEVRVAGLPHAVHVSGSEHCVCHGYFGPHEQIVAEDHSHDSDLGPVGEVTDAARPAPA